MSTEQLSELRAIASKTAQRAYVPYSGSEEAAILLLSDGRWIPGVRVESASYSLVIQPLLNAVTTAVALDRTDVVAAVMSRPLTPSERNYAALNTILKELQPRASDALVGRDGSLPEASEAISPFVREGSDLTAEAALDLARDVAGRAYVPESDFPVGCVVCTSGTAYVPGVNVEHPDWNHIICAERNAVGTCMSYGLQDEVVSMHLTCLKDPTATPCGACRQLLVELVPTAALWMDRGEAPPAQSDPLTLLPGSFNGEHLSSRT